MDIITQLSQTVVIATFLCGAFSYVVLKPLKETIANQADSFDKSIATLNATVSDLRSVVRNAETQRNALQERVAKVEASAASAHRRIDRLDHLEHFDGMGAH